jgi:exonuclease VII small subunit
MNKKVENANVVSETKKITEEQLKELQEHVNRINQAQLQLGQLTSQKVIHTLSLKT